MQLLDVIMLLPHRPAALSYHAEVSIDLLSADSTLIDWLIGFAFDTLGAIQLDVRVTADSPCP